MTQDRLGADPAFRRYLAARITSLAGSGVTFVVMPVLMYAVTGSPLWTSAVTVAEALPYLLVGLVAGAVADRVDRRRLMVGADLTSALLLASIPVAYALGVLGPAHVLVVAFAAQTVFVFFDAANFGALPLLVGRDRLGRANAAVFGWGTVVETGAPPLAGALLAVLPAAPLLAVDAASFLASAALIRAVRRPLSDPARSSRSGRVPLRRLVSDVRAGLSFLLGQPIVRIMTFLGAAQSFSGGAFVGQLVVWADRVLGVRGGDPRLGILFGSWGVGGVLAALLLPRMARRLGEARVTLVFLPVSAAVGTLAVLPRDWRLATAGQLAWGLAYMVVVVNSITVRQQLTPEPLLSRVNTAGRMLSFGLGYPAGAVAGGVLSSHLGPRTAIILGMIPLLLGAAYAWLSPLRGLARLRCGGARTPSCPCGGCPRTGAG